MEALMNELLLSMEAQINKPLDSDDLAHEILATTAKVLYVDVEDILSVSHQRDISDARKIAIYLISEYTNMPYRMIGELFGGRDHSTISYNRYGAEDLMFDKRFLRKLTEVKQQLGL